MKYSIFVILGITATLLVFSLLLFFNARKKEKSFSCIFIIPICIGLMAITGMSLGLTNKLEYNKFIEEKNQEITCFLNDYKYYCDTWADIVNYCENNEIDFSQTYDIEPTLEQNKLSKKVLQYDTFYRYFSRYYPRANNSYEGDYTITLELIENYYTGENGSIPFAIYKFSGDGSSYSKPSFTNEYELNEERNKLYQITESDKLKDIISQLQFNSNVHTNYYDNNPFTFAEYIIMIIYVSLIVLFNFISMIYYFARHKENLQPNTNNIADISQIESKMHEQKTIKNEELPPPPPKPTWEELKEENKKSYIDNAIKELYERQLKETNSELTRQQRALKKDCLETKDFLIEDLTEEEKQKVETIAKRNYDNNLLNKNKNISITPKKSDYRTQYYKSKGFRIRLGFYISLTTMILGFAFDLVAGLTSETASESPLFTIGLAISFASLLPLIILWFKKKEYCKICGCKGEVKQIEERYLYQSVETPGVVTNESVGYIHAECPNCHNTWKVRYSKKQLK